MGYKWEWSIYFQPASDGDGGVAAPVAYGVALG